jgi:group I intron endonuclease
MKTNYGVYQIENLKDGKVYIGSSGNLKSRKYVHFNLLKNNSHTNKHMQRAYNKHKKHNFEWSILKYLENKEELLKWEQKYLNEYIVENNIDSSKCYNVLSIAGSNLGYNHLEETKKKISESNKGKIGSNLGKKFSEEHKNKISETHKKNGHKPTKEALDNSSLKNKTRVRSEEEKERRSISLKGREVTEETKNKISYSEKGKIISDETRVKISLSKKGKKHSEETKNKISESLKNRNKERYNNGTVRTVT